MANAYTALLNADMERNRAAQASAAAAAGREAAAQAARERLTPLHVRLAALLATIPAEVKREGLSLPALQARLRGRRREIAHAGQVGEALRALGWVRRRGWQNGSAGGFSARWFERAA